ncbi:MAG: radical SAM protein [Deltaproteobacteria bacterium]|nr:radical SAM protein [Deltaproteobacteria bacterium]
MRVLLVATNRESSPFPVSPLGVLAVAGAALAAGHEVDFVDCMFAPEPVSALGRALDARAYDVLGFGIRNLDNCFWPAPRHFFEDVRVLVEAARQTTTAPIVLGGSGFSVAPHGWLSRLDADYGVVGEGENAFTALLAALADGRRPDGIPGIVTTAAGRQGGGRPSRAPASFAPSVAALARPAHHLVDYERYVRRGGFVTVQTKRGCAFACGYCVYPQLEGTMYRHRPVDAIVDEMEAVVRAQNVRQFFFADSVFNAPRVPALELCRALTRRDLGVGWMAYANAAGFDEELAHAMAGAGCLGVEFGFDAVTDKMLRAWRKPFGQRDVARSLRACREAGLPAAVHLLFGGPGEIVDDIRESQAYLDACAPVDAVFASLGVRIYEGAPIAARARAEGVIDDDTDLFFPAWYVSAGLGQDPMRALDGIARRRDHWTTATDWTSRTMRVIQASANRFGGQPLWRNVREYGRRLRSSRT